VRFLFAAFCITIASFACTAQRPNVVLIICDDLNDSVVGFGGHPQAITPNMDRLAQRGIRFLNAYANAPICGPSRASMITGVYPHRSGEFGYRQNSRAPWRINEILRQAVTMPEHFAGNGYRVMAAGKITHQHIMDRDLWRNADGEIEYSIPLDYGPWPYDGESPVPLAHPNLPFKGFFWGFGPLSDLPVFKRGQDTITGGWRNYVPGLEKEKVRKYFELVGDDLEFFESGDPIKQHYAVSTDRWRYILCADGSSELYDLQQDPHEWKNLSGRPEVASIEVELKNRLIEMGSVKSSMKK